MILQRLVDYYRRMAASPEDPIPTFGFSRERISFELVVDPMDLSAELNDLRTELRRHGAAQKTEYVPRWMVVPYRGDRSSNVKANFLWDNSGYVLGRTSKAAVEEKKRKDFLDLHERILSQCGDEALAAVVAFLRRWQPSEFEKFAVASEAVDQNIVLRLKNERRYVHERESLREAWTTFFRSDVEQRSAFDLVGGQQDAIAATHFLVGGVKGAQPTGASLSSFNDTAYTSYGLKTAFNSPVSIENVFAYTTALKELLSYQRRKMWLGDATVVCWTAAPTLFERVAADLFADWVPPANADVPPEDKAKAEEVRLFLSQMRDGHASQQVLETEESTPFFVLGMAAPALSRISVRFWVQTDVAEMKRRLAQHMSDIELVGAREGEEMLMIRRIVLATGRAETDAKGRPKSYDADTVSPMLAGAVAQAVFTGGCYPQALLSGMLNRLRADGVVSHVRVAAIKGCLVRKSRINGNPKEVPVALDTSRTEPAYVTGRLFALLEKIQSDSVRGNGGGELNSTIKDRYFSAASATPGVVFPRLIRLSQHHLAKLETGQKVYYEKQLGEVMNKLERFASHLMLEDQGLFAVGYFHQRQDLFTSKKEQEGASE